MNTSNFKIQVKSEDFPRHENLPWFDMEKMPPFESYDQARQWMEENGCQKLQEEWGLQFRIVPNDFESATVSVKDDCS